MKNKKKGREIKLYFYCETKIQENLLRFLFFFLPNTKITKWLCFLIFPVDKRTLQKILYLLLLFEAKKKEAKT